MNLIDGGKRQNLRMLESESLSRFYQNHPMTIYKPRKHSYSSSHLINVKKDFTPQKENRLNNENLFAKRLNKCQTKKSIFLPILFPNHKEKKNQITRSTQTTEQKQLNVKQLDYFSPFERENEPKNIKTREDIFFEQLLSEKNFRKSKNVINPKTYRENYKPFYINKNYSEGNFGLKKFEDGNNWDLRDEKMKIKNENVPIRKREFLDLISEVINTIWRKIEIYSSRNEFISEEIFFNLIDKEVNKLFYKDTDKSNFKKRVEKTVKKLFISSEKEENIFQINHYAGKSLNIVSNRKNKYHYTPLKQMQLTPMKEDEKISKSLTKKYNEIKILMKKYEINQDIRTKEKWRTQIVKGKAQKILRTHIMMEQIRKTIINNLRQQNIFFDDVTINKIVDYYKNIEKIPEELKEEIIQKIPKEIEPKIKEEVEKIKEIIEENNEDSLYDFLFSNKFKEKENNIDFNVRKMYKGQDLDMDMDKDIDFDLNFNMNRHMKLNRNRNLVNDIDKDIDMDRYRSMEGDIDDLYIKLRGISKIQNKSETLTPFQNLQIINPLKRNNNLIEKNQTQTQKFENMNKIDFIKRNTNQYKGNPNKYHYYTYNQSNQKTTSKNPNAKNKQEELEDGTSDLDPELKKLIYDQLFGKKNTNTEDENQLNGKKHILNNKKKKNNNQTKSNKEQSPNFADDQEETSKLKGSSYSKKKPNTIQNKKLKIGKMSAYKGIRYGRILSRKKGSNSSLKITHSTSAKKIGGYYEENNGLTDKKKEVKITIEENNNKKEEKENEDKDKEEAKKIEEVKKDENLNKEKEQKKKEEKKIREEKPKSFFNLNRYEKENNGKIDDLLKAIDQEKAKQDLINQQKLRLRELGNKDQNKGLFYRGYSGVRRVAKKMELRHIDKDQENSSFHLYPFSDKKKSAEVVKFTLSQDLLYCLKQENISEEEQKMYNDFKEKLETLKFDDPKTDLNLLYSNLKDELDEIHQIHDQERRINMFNQNLSFFRQSTKAKRILLEKTIKWEDNKF